MQNTAILALDQGTSSSRAMLFDRAGQLLASAQQEICCSYPAPGYVEQNPDEIWLSVLAVCRQMLQFADSHHIKVAGLAMTNQRETTVLWRRDNGVAVAPAIVWQDRRTQAYCASLQAGVLPTAGTQQVESTQHTESAQHTESTQPLSTAQPASIAAFIQQKTGLCLDPYFSASKLHYLLQDPQLRQAAEQGELAFGTIDSFLLWRLSAGPAPAPIAAAATDGADSALWFDGQNALHATDTTNASRTLLFNIKTLQWDAQLLQLFGVPASLLPAVRQSADDYGQVHPAWFCGQALPILALCGDQQAAAIGQGCVQAGGLKSTYGTGCFALLNTGEQLLLSRQRLLSTIAFTVKGQTHYALEGSIFVAGAAVKWLRDQLGLLHSAAESEQLAQSVSDSGGVYLVPAFTGLGAPYWRPDVRAQFSGLTLGTSKAQLVRATLEAVVYQTSDLLQAMQRDGATPLSLQVDGGMVDNRWFCQQLADVLNLPVMRPLQTETTAFGAALLAGITLGWYAGLTDLPALVRAESWFYPQMSAADRTLCLTGWQQAVQALLASGNTPAAPGAL